MVRSVWIKTVVVALATTGLVWGQSTTLPQATNKATRAAEDPTGRIITVSEPGKPAQKCKILKYWKQPDGGKALQVRSLQTGEMMTIVEEGLPTYGPGIGTGNKPRTVVSRIYHWGSKDTPPPGTPTPPVKIVGRAPATPTESEQTKPLPPVVTTNWQPTQPPQPVVKAPVIKKPEIKKPVVTIRPTTTAAQKQPTLVRQRMDQAKDKTPKAPSKVVVVPPTPRVMIKSSKPSVPSVPSTPKVVKTKTTGTITRPAVSKLPIQERNPVKTQPRPDPVLVKQPTKKTTLPPPVMVKKTPSLPPPRIVKKPTKGTLLPPPAPVSVKKPTLPPPTLVKKPTRLPDIQTTSHVVPSSPKMPTIINGSSKKTTTIIPPPAPVTYPAVVSHPKPKVPTQKKTLYSPPTPPPAPRVANRQVRPRTPSKRTLYSPSTPRKRTAVNRKPTLPVPPTPVAKTDTAKPAPQQKTRTPLLNRLMGRNKKQPQPAKVAKVPQPPKTPGVKKPTPAVAKKADPLFNPAPYSRDPSKVKTQPKPPAPATPIRTASGTVGTPPKLGVGNPNRSTRPVAATTTTPRKHPLGMRSVVDSGTVPYMPVPIVSAPQGGRKLPPNVRVPQAPRPIPPARPGVGYPEAGSSGLAVNAFTPAEHVPPKPGTPLASLKNNAFSHGRGIRPNMVMPTAPRPPMGPMHHPHPHGMPPGYPGKMMVQAQRPTLPTSPQVTLDPRQGVRQANHAPTGASGIGRAHVSSASPMVPPQKTWAPTTANLKQLMTMLQESLYPSQREWAAEQLSRLDWRAHKEIVPAIIRAAREDAAGSVRAGSIRVLAKMKINSLSVLNTLRDLRNDSDPRVRTEADAALRELSK